MENTEINILGQHQVELREGRGIPKSVGQANKIQRFQLCRQQSFFVEEGQQIIPVTILDANDQEILPEDIISPPDGGYGWVIVFAAFITSVILGGTIFTFGVMLTAILESFQADDNSADGTIKETEISVSTIASIGGSLTACSLFTGPFAAALVNKIGYRLTAVAGSIVAFLGFVGSWYFCADGRLNIPGLLVCYGVIGGTGIGLLFIPTIVTIGYYFEERRALATGIANCGMGVGTCGFPPILSALIARIQWQRTLLIQALLLLSCGLFAAFYRPLEFTKNAHKNKRHHMTSDMKPTEASSFEPSSKQILNFAAPGAFSQKESAGCTGQSDCLDDVFEEKIILDFAKPTSPARKFARIQSFKYPSITEDSIDVFDPPRRISIVIPASPLQRQSSGQSHILHVEDKSALNKPMNRNNIFYRGSIRRSVEDYEDNTIDLILANSTWHEEFVSTQCQEISSKHKKSWLKRFRSFNKFDVLSKMLNFRLLKSPVLLLVCLMSGLSLMGTFIPIVYIKGLSLEHGFDEDESTLLISVFGISDMFGRILSGALATYFGNHVILINNSALIVGGIVVILTPLSPSYAFLVATTVIFGLASASVQSLRSILLVDLLGLENLTTAIGLTLFCEGIATLFGSPFAGYLRDTTGSYDLSFYVGGGILIVAGLICSPIYILKNFMDMKKGQDNTI